MATGLPDLPWFDHASPRRRWLVGVSGGADSVALVRLLVTRGFRNLVVCHLDHGLRGDASAADARFVGALARDLGLGLASARVPVARLAAAAPESVETAARRARYAFFGRCARRFRSPRLILAHHADDQAETVLWNLLRGSHGPKGMKPLRHIAVGEGAGLEIHRPLLDCRRSDLRAWLGSRGFGWREDATNALPLAVRNRLRLEAMPLLSQIADRDIVPMLARAAQAGSDAGEITRWALDHARPLDPQGRLHIPVLRALPRALRAAAVASYLEAHQVPGISRDLLDKIDSMFAVGGPARINLSGGGWIRRSGGRLEIWRFP